VSDRTTSTLLLAVLLGSILLGLCQSTALGAPGIPDPRFGVVETYAAPQAATAVGAGWTRVTFRWNEIQPDGPHQWNVSPISDQTLSNELSRGREAVGLLVTTPGWATDRDVGPGVPRGLHLPTDHPDNLWATFVRTIVDRYAGRINHWIVWNEPDIPDTQHMSWGGSVEDFARLLQVAYSVAKETNPDAVIHMAAVTHWWDEDWFSRFLDVMVSNPHAAANNYYFDVATLHIYFQPETVYDITAHYARMMRGHGIHKPIWIAETNAAPSHDPAWPVPNPQFDVSLEQQAAYVVQALSLGIAAGAQRIAVYKMADTPTDRAANPEPFGLVRADGSRRPAFTAYRTATTYLAGFRGGTWDRRDAISLVTVDRGDRTTTVAWARGAEPQTAMIPARTTRALLVDIHGGARYVYPERGYYYVDLPPAHCSQGCQIGGAPYMLVEQAPASANTAPAPQPPTIAPTDQAAAPSPTASPFTQDSSPIATATPPPTATPLPTDISPSIAPTATATSSSTSSPPPTATATSSPTPTPSLTPSPDPTPSRTPLPSPTPAAPTAAGRPWVLTGALIVGLVGVAVAAGLTTIARGTPQKQENPDVEA
jgi:hypothetical protein